MKSTHHLQYHLLATAVAAALAFPLQAAAVDQQDAPIFNTSAIESGAEFHGFIVKFRDGSAEQRDTRLVQQALQRSTAALNASMRTATGSALQWDPLESTCRHASLSIL